MRHLFVRKVSKERPKFVINVSQTDPKRVRNESETGPNRVLRMTMKQTTRQRQALQYLPTWVKCNSIFGRAQVKSS